jgi:hypothetical protein
VLKFKVYYWNVDTKETTWERPMPVSKIKTRSNTPGPAEREVFDTRFGDFHHHFYYYYYFPFFSILKDQSGGILVPSLEVLPKKFSWLVQKFPQSKHL